MPKALRIEFDVEMRSSGGTKFLADVYRPAEGRFPALLMRTPYSKSILPGLMAVLNPVRAAHEDFAVVVQDVRGRFASGGDFLPFANEGKDGAEAVQWVAEQPWCDGRVAMFGSSYMGATQMQAGVLGPKALAALCPIQASSDYFEGRSYRGGAFELGALSSIALWGLGAGTLLRSGIDRKLLRERFTAIRHALSDMQNFLNALPFESLRNSVLGEIAPFLFEWWEHDKPEDEYWTTMSLEGRYGGLSVPALHISSWYDQFHVGTLRNYEGLRKGAATAEAREGQSLIVGPWAHYPPKSSLLGSVRVGDLGFGLDAMLDLEATQLAWFKRWLKGDTAAWRERKRVRLFVMGRNEWRDEDDWPLARAKETSLYFDPAASGDDGVLRWHASDRAAQENFTFDPASPVPTRGGAHLCLESAFPQGPVDQRDIQTRPDVLVHHSELLSDDLEVTGWVRAVLWVRSSAPSTDFTVRLVDTWPDGRAFGVCDGIRRVRFSDIEACEGWYRIEVPLGATSMMFRRGHRITVQISSSNFPRFDINPNTGELPRTASRRVPARQEISMGGAMASCLMLPVVS